MLEFDSASMKKLTQRSKIGDGYLQVVKEAGERVEKLFVASMHSARVGFLIALIMDISVFVVGILLVLASVATALAHGATGQSALSWEGTGAAGGTGLLAVAYSTFLKDPRKKVKSAVDHVMGIKVRYGIVLRRYRGPLAPFLLDCFQKREAATRYVRGTVLIGEYVTPSLSVPESGHLPLLPARAQDRGRFLHAPADGGRADLPGGR